MSKFLNDYFSILCFFIAWIISKSIYTATAVGMASSGLQFAFVLIKHRAWKPVRLVALTLVFWLVFGGLTLYFHNQHFIQWKPTILYWCLALAFLLSPLVIKENLYKKLLKDKIYLPEQVWSQINISWIVFFIVMGILNIVVAYGFSLQTWVYYKIFGTLAISFVFIIAQALYMNKYMEDVKDDSSTPSGEQS